MSVRYASSVILGITVLVDSVAGLTKIVLSEDNAIVLCLVVSKIREP